MCACVSVRVCACGCVRAPSVLLERTGGLCCHPILYIWSPQPHTGIFVWLGLGRAGSQEDVGIYINKDVFKRERERKGEEVCSLFSVFCLIFICVVTQNERPWEKFIKKTKTSFSHRHVKDATTDNKNIFCPLCWFKTISLFVKTSVLLPSTGLPLLSVFTQAKTLSPAAPALARSPRAHVCEIGLLIRWH